MSHGKILREKRTQQGISRAALAEQLGVTEAFIGLLENERRLPSAELLPSLLDALAINEEEREQILGLIEEGQKQKAQVVAQRRSGTFRAAIRAHEGILNRSEALNGTQDTSEDARILAELQSDPELRALWNDIRAACTDPQAKDTLQQMARLLVRRGEAKD